MSDECHRYTTPKKILLATDLSGRCDRALDRAVLLADEWKANLVVVHALEPEYQTTLEAEHAVPSWRRDSRRRVSIAEQQVREDLSGRDIPFEIIIEDGTPTELILKVAGERGCDLIVTGTARNETFGRFILGSTVDRLARRAPVPVLVVKARARRPYAHVAVATDFSDTARRALEGAAELFPRAALVLLHGYRPVGPLTTGKDGDEAGRELAARACAKFLTEANLPPESRSKLQVLMESGSIELIVHAYARDNGLDLLVVGGRGRNAVLDLLLGSTAEALLSSAPCDVLVMREY